jgi:hypothetical protein
MSAKEKSEVPKKVKQKKKLINETKQALPGIFLEKVIGGKLENSVKLSKGCGTLTGCPANLLC